MTYEEFGKAYLTAIIKGHSNNTSKANEGAAEVVALAEAYPEFEARADADDALWSKANIRSLTESRAEENFELGRDYGRVNGWYSDDDPGYNDD